MRLHVVALCVVGAATAAHADAILSFGFTDLNGSFDLGTATFTAVGVNSAPLHTAGSVNRLQAPIGNAQYNAGTAAGLVNLTLSVTNIVGTTAQGSGSITIFDADGDSFTSNITGDFSWNNPAVFFNGSLTNPVFVPDPSGTNNTFDGPSGGSFPLTFAPAQPPFTGALVQLYFNSAFFSQSFSGIATQVNGSVIPAPGALGLLAVGMAALGRRRR